jgi:Flp pilus assembly protein TadG
MKLGKSRKGQIGVIMTLVIATLLGVMTLCADVGVMYYNYLRLQKGTDAAAVAGANYLNGGVTFASASVNANCTGEPDDAQKAACTYAISNGLATDANSLKMNENVAVGPTPNLQVIANASLPYMFGRVIGLSTYKMAAVATAKSTLPANSVNGLFPMGMQCTSPCSLSSIKPGSSVPFGVKFTPAEGGAPGNWQWMGSGGAQTLGASITSGISGTWSIGDTISTSPGNKGNSGPASSAWDARMASCASLSEDPCASGSNPSNIPSGDPCLVTVPAVDFGGCNGRCSATIEGFAQIYIEPTSTIKHGSNITACYVKSVDGNIVSGSTGALDLGAIEPPKLIQ